MANPSLFWTKSLCTKNVQMCKTDKWITMPRERNGMCMTRYIHWNHVIWIFSKEKWRKHKKNPEKLSNWRICWKFYEKEKVLRNNLNNLIDDANDIFIEFIHFILLCFVFISKYVFILTHALSLTVKLI